MLRLNSTAATAVVATFLAAGCVHASPVVLTFTGIITGSNVDGVFVGSTFTGFLRYDSTDQLVSSNSGSDTFAFGSADLLSVTIGANTFSMDSNGFPFGPGPILETIFDNVAEIGLPARDVFMADSVQGVEIDSPLPGLMPVTMAFEIAGPNGLLSGPALPESFDLSKVDFATIGISFLVGGQSEGFVSQLSSITLEGTEPSTVFLTVPVIPLETPEPATVFLMAPALLGLLLRKRRK